MQTLEVKRRGATDSINALKKLGRIPAVFYGPKEKSTSVSISIAEFRKVWKAAGESAVITLKDGTHDHESLIHDFDAHPVTGAPRHVDFYVIEKGKKIQVSIPLVFEGVSAAIKDKAGILVKVHRDIKIEAAPKDLPHEIKVDISALVELTSTIHARDLKLPAGVTLEVPGDEIIASVAVAKEEVEEAPAVVDLSSIEVAKKGKEAKEGEAPADGATDSTAAPAKKEGK